MNQMIVSLLNTLGLKSDPQTSVVFRNTVEAITQPQIDSVGQGFPFTGDATIDGTLNIDFTGTLDFYSGDSLELESDPVNQIILKGDMIGLHFTEGDNEIYSGLIDGVVDIFNGSAEIGTKSHHIQYKDKDSGDFVISNLGRYSFPSEIEGGDEAVYITPMQAVFVNSDDSFTEYTLRANRTVGTDDTELQFGKFVDDGVDSQSTYLTMDGNNTAIQFTNDLIDNTASVYRFEDNNGDVLFDIRNNGLFVGPNIPTASIGLESGQIWLDGDTLKVSAGPLP